MKEILRDLGGVRELLTRSQRKSAVVLVFLMLVGMVLETLGVGVVIPALRVLSDPEMVLNYRVLGDLTASLGQPSPAELMVGGMVVVTLIYAVKAAFLSYLVWRSHRFAYLVEADLAERLLGHYLRQPWTFHLQRNSAELIRNVITETTMFRGDALIAGMSFVTETLVFLGITALLFAIEPVGAFTVILVLGVAAVGFTRVTRVPLKRWSVARQEHDKLRIQHIQQGIGGAKEVKLLGREAGLLSQFKVHNDGAAAVGRRWSTLQEIPRLLIELVGVLGVTILLILMLAQGRPIDAVIPTLGLFAVAAFRLMPSANRMLTTLQRVRYARAVVENLESELAGYGPPPVRTNREEDLPFEKVIRVADVTFTYPEAETPAVDSVNLTIPRGSTVGIIGESGGGKSTLVDVILGLLTPDHGAVYVDSCDIRSGLRAWQNRIGYVPQSIFLTDDSLRKNIALGVSDGEIDDVAIQRAVRDARLDEFVATLPKGLNTLVGERGIRISGGERQRIGIARSLYHDPEILVLDEATSSLDTETEKGVMEAVRALEGQKTIVIVAHRLMTVAHCDRIFRIDRGKVVEEGEPGLVFTPTEKASLSPR